MDLGPKTKYALLLAVLVPIAFLGGAKVNEYNEIGVLLMLTAGPMAIGAAALGFVGRRQKEGTPATIAMVLGLIELIVWSALWSLIIESLKSFKTA